MNARAEVEVWDFFVGYPQMVCHGDRVRAGASIAIAYVYEGELPITVTISSSLGDSFPFTFTESDLDGDGMLWTGIECEFPTASLLPGATKLTVTISPSPCNGTNTLTAFVSSVLGVSSYPSDSGGTTTVAVDQGTSFHSELNSWEYAGGETNWAPPCLTWSPNVYWSTNENGDALSAWATGVWTNASWQDIIAYVGDTSATNTITVVSAAIKDLTFGGTGYADIKKDDDGSLYTTPHWPGSDGPVPFQLAMGTNPIVTASFSVEPSDWSGTVYITAGGFPTNGLNSNTYSAQAFAPFQNTVGHDTSRILNWQFSVAEQVFFDAGTSTNEIYYTLSAPSAHYHTSVHTACHGVSGSDETNVFGGIWGKFASVVSRK